MSEDIFQKKLMARRLSRQVADGSVMPEKKYLKKICLCASLMRELPGRATLPDHICQTVARRGCGQWAAETESDALIAGQKLLKLPDDRYVDITSLHWPIPVKDTNRAVFVVLRQWIEQDEKGFQAKFTNLLQGFPEWHEAITEIQTFYRPKSKDPPNVKTRHFSPQPTTLLYPPFLPDNHYNLIKAQAVLRRLGLPANPNTAEYALWIAGGSPETDPTPYPSRGALIVTFALSSLKRDEEQADKFGWGIGKSVQVFHSNPAHQWMPEHYDEDVPKVRNAHITLLRNTGFAILNTSTRRFNSRAREHDKYDEAIAEFYTTQNWDILQRRVRTITNQIRKEICGEDADTHEHEAAWRKVKARISREEKKLENQKNPSL
jgi:hypothetical protein